MLPIRQSPVFGAFERYDWWKRKYLACLRVLLYDFEGFKDDGFYSGILWVVGESEWDSLVLLHFL